MSHDSLCPWNQPCPGSYDRGPHEFVPLNPPDLPLVCYHCTSTECQCDLIAKVRADERAAYITAVEAALLAKIEAVRQHYYEIGIDLQSEGWLQWKSAMKTASKVAATVLRKVQPQFGVQMRGQQMAENALQPPTTISIPPPPPHPYDVREVQP